MNSKDVVKAWVANPAGVFYSGGALHTERNIVLSYAMIIARCKDGKYYVRKRGPSMTTNKHIGLIKRAIPAGLLVECDECD